MMVLLASLAAWADVNINTTNFPDAKFRAFLIAEYPSGVITTAQLNARTSLELQELGISNLKGIEFFPNLTLLRCQNNNLSSVDLSHNTKLVLLNLAYNKLVSVSLTNNTELEKLYIQSNPSLTSLNVTDHSKLKLLYTPYCASLQTLFCYRCALTSLTVTGCSALKQLKCYENPNLTEIEGLGDCTNLTWLDCEDCKVSDLSATSNMNKLERLLCRNNKLTSLSINNKNYLNYLRVSGNSQLTELSCYSNNLISLDVTNCTAMTDLRCYYNANLTEITGLASCKAITYLDCDGCSITDLSAVEGMTNLERLICRNNKFTSLSVTNKSKLVYLMVKGNTLMTSLYCNDNALTSLDVAQCTALKTLYCYSNSNLATITGLADCTNLETLRCHSCALTDLSAVSGMTKLTDLRCGWNKLTTLNVSNKTKLVYLLCQNNLLTTLNISGCTVLKELYCGGNKFTGYSVTNFAKLETVDVSNSTSLTTLKAYNNPLMNKLNVGGCTSLTEFDCAPSAALAKITGLGDCTALKTLYCYGCILNTLEGINNLTKLEKLYCHSNKLTSLEVTNKSNLTFLDCQNNTSLTSLRCSRNNLSTLVVTGNTSLKDLRCYENANLATITGLADCTAITYLDCEDDQITDLSAVQNMTNLEKFYARNNKLSGTFTLKDKSKLEYVRLSGNKSLTRVDCYGNAVLDKIDVSNCSAMTTLNVYNNKLTSVDVSGCSVLYDFSCRQNQLTSLNLSGCPKLGKLYCYENKLTSLNLSSCPELLLLYCYKNNIKGANMETMINSLPTRMASSPGAFRVIYNSGEGNTISAPQVIKARQKYWIPMRYDGSSWVEIEAHLQGDVNGDGEVNIADVNALIDLILKNQSSANADVNGDNEVNIADVNALIDLILKQ